MYLSALGPTIKVVLVDTGEKSQLENGFGFGVATWFKDHTWETGLKNDSLAQILEKVFTGLSLSWFLRFES